MKMVLLWNLLKMKKLNVDPAYELEEMIIESKPIHKKHARLSKTASMDGAAMKAVSTYRYLCVE